MKCGGSGWIAGAETIVKTASVEGPYGGSDGFVRIMHRAADHRPETWTVTTYSSIADVDMGTEEFDTLEAARTAANLAFRTMKAQIAASYAARRTSKENR